MGSPGALTSRPILVVGATGMLGRPVVRRLAEEGFALRALVRDPDRARRLLPATCELVPGDVGDRTSIREAMTGVDAVYINLAEPFSKRRWDPEHEGTRAIADLAHSCGVQRLLKISAMGIDRASEQWWAARRKTEADEAVAGSGVAYTIFRPTWFMESLPLFVARRWMILPRTPAVPLYWIAGDDYARQVATALRTDRAVNRVYSIQGPQALTFDEAAERFSRADPGHPRVLRLPRWMVAGAGVLSPPARYLGELLTFTFRWNVGFQAQAAWDDLGEPTMTIEDYVRYMERSGDVPRK